MQSIVRRPKWLNVLAACLLVAGLDSMGAMPAAAASAPYLVKDIKPGPGGTIPVEITALGDIVLFNGGGGGQGRELYRSDGTARGTYRVADIRPGRKSSHPTALTKVGNKIFFSANDGMHGEELWITDGTKGGTHLVKDLITGPESSMRQESYHQIAADVNGIAYFSGVPQGQLWRSDGTDAGTYPIPNSPTYVANLTAFGSRVYFGAEGRLWRSNGTATGTKRVRNSGGFYLSEPVEMVATDEYLFFQYRGSRLWRSDGTAAGTFKIFDAGPGCDVDCAEMMMLTRLGRAVVFFPQGTGQIEVWRSDGNDGSDVHTFRLASHLRSIGTGSFSVVGNLLYIDENRLPAWVWVTDGWHFATRVDVPDDLMITIYDVKGVPYYVGELLADRVPHLYRTDGTAAGTVQVGPPSPTWPDQLTVAGDRVYFRATDERGTELWAMSL